MNEIVRHLLVGTEIVARKSFGLAIYLHVGWWIDDMGGLVPVEEGGAEGGAFEILHEDSASEFPKVFLIEEVCRVAWYECFDMEIGVELLDE